jgi:hypothetical protein
MTAKTIHTFLILMLTIVAPASAQDGLALMKVETGARPFGMAGAFVSVTDDPNASFYNPANAVGSERFTVSFGHNTHWENVRLETGYFTGSLTAKTWLHGGIRYAAVDDIESRLTPTLEPDALFSAYDISFKAGLSHRVNDKLSAGMAFGWYIEKIDIYRGSSFNVDLGLNYRATPQVALGASVTNLGGDMTVSVSGQQGGDKVSLPTTYRFGGSYTNELGLAAADAVIIDGDFHLHIGVEPQLHEYFTVRAGFMAGYDTKNFTAGASFRHREFTIDYAFVPYSDNLGTSHLFNLTFTL